MADGTSGNVSVGEAANTTAATCSTTTTTTASSSEGSWWGGWLKSAMDTSTSALEFIKRDLAEFTSTMERDTARAAEVTKTVLQDSLKKENSTATKDKMKQGINMMFDGLSKALTTSMVEKHAQRESSSSGNVFDRSLARLHAVQVDTGTYLDEPSGDPEEFRAWQAGFNQEERKGDISELLVSKVEVRALYTRLVPTEVSHSDFWQRYFYKLHQLKQDELRKQALMKRAEKQPSEEDSLDWEDDWSGDEEGTLMCEDPRLLAPAAEPNAKTGTMGERAPSSSSSPATSADPSHPASASTPTVIKTQTPDLPVIDATQFSNDPSKPLDADKENRPDSNPPAENQGKEDLGLNTFEDVSPSDEKKLQSEEATIASTDKSPTPPTVSPQSVPEPQTHSHPISQEKETVPPVSAGNEQPKKPASAAPAEQGSEKRPPQAVLPMAAASEKGMESLGQLTGLVPEVVAVASQGSAAEPRDLKTREKGDMVLVGSERGSPISDSSDVKVTDSKGVATPSTTDKKRAATPSGSAAKDVATPTPAEGYSEAAGTPRVEGGTDAAFLRLVPETSLEDDWEQDFDVELTEEDLKAAEEIAKRLGDNVDIGDDWENWE